MPRPEVPDTTVFVRLAHGNANLEAFVGRVATGNVWISSIVLAELHAGSRSAEEARLLRRFASVVRRRLIAPSAEDWMLAGQLMARRIRLHGALRPRDHFNDLLILITAARLRGTVTTANLRHFEGWLPLLRASRLDVHVGGDPAVSA